MAKAPSARVPKTSGQGVSRLSYQKAYALRRKAAGGGDNPVPSVKNERVEIASSGTRRPGKGAIDGAGGMNISYGDTIPIGDLKDISEVGARKLPKSPGFLKQGKPVDYGKKGKRK